ncbi:hypothetical protein [Paraburkholderia bannensis]|uniref:hypothetical protein n=1 Tax=Paraburkholderia bannensis TaxID=765414 RepID=UPI0005A721F4|nr:hypothetical protein [Paraburkholderia bannensis]
MAKATPLTSADLTARRTKAKSATQQRGAVPSADLVPLQFKMPPEFVREFKQAALDHDMKLNTLLAACFQEFMKSGK